VVFKKGTCIGSPQCWWFLKGYVYWVTTVLVVFKRVRVLGYHSAGGF